jgi:hypothetical protein
MSQPIPQWLDRILVDLREFSVDLLEVGLAPKAVGIKSEHQSSPLRATMHAAESLCKRIPRLLEELETEESLSIAELVSSPTPRFAIRSSRPSDYAFSAGRMLPSRWLRPEQSPELRVEPLRWVVGVADELRGQLKLHASRFTKQIEIARFTRGGDSSYALSDLKVLDQIFDSILRAEHRLDQSVASIYRRVGRTLPPSYRLPHPFPKPPTWQLFRREAHYYKNPKEMLGPWLGELLKDPIPVADVPFLYQRWCGLQIIFAASRLGWDAVGDVVGPLFLGGPIELQHADTSIELWVEPRLAASQADRIGWYSERRGEELTPDFMFVCGERGERDAFILDATLATSDALLAEKGKYRERLVGEDVQFVAGIPVGRRPLRAWAMAPTKSAICQLGDPQGWTGVIPLNACSSDFSGLEAWLRDLFRHAVH